MPQYRLTWAKVVDSEDFNELPDDTARVFWLILPVRLDRSGRAYDDPQWLRSMIFTKRRDVTLEIVESIMNACENLGMIVRYEVCGKKYFYVPSFKKYQRGTNKEAKSVIPAPIRSHRLNGTITEHSGVSPELVRSKSPSDADADSNADSKALKAGASADAPPAPNIKSTSEKTPTQPDDSLLVSLTPGGQVLLKQYEKLAVSKGKKSSLKRYGNEQQRKAFEAVYASLNGELGDLIDKGFAHNRTTVSALLSWLEGCVKRAKEQPPLAAKRNNRPSREQDHAAIEEAFRRRNVTG